MSDNRTGGFFDSHCRGVYGTTATWRQHLRPTTSCSYTMYAGH